MRNPFRCETSKSFWVIFSSSYKKNMSSDSWNFRYLLHPPKTYTWSTILISLLTQFQPLVTNITWLMIPSPRLLERILCFLILFSFSLCYTTLTKHALEYSAVAWFFVSHADCTFLGGDTHFPCMHTIAGFSILLKYHPSSPCIFPV